MKKLLSRLVSLLLALVLPVVAITDLVVVVLLHKVANNLLVKEKAVTDDARHCKIKKEDK